MTLDITDILYIDPRLPDLDLTEDGKWITGEVILVYDHGELVCTVPKGSETDFASLPRVARVLFRTWGKWTVAAVVHDYLYRHGQEEWDRAYVDKLFYRIMRIYGTGAATAWLFYMGVRLNLRSALTWGR